MAIERTLEQGPLQPFDLEEAEIEIVEPMGDPSIQETEDGGMLIDFTGEDSAVDDSEFGDNLAELMDDDDIGRLSNELLGFYHSDRNSRKDWEEAYIKGLNQLGLKIEERTSPWDGACGVTHPILSEAVVRFQSQAIGEIFPGGGPVRTKIVGKVTPERVKQADRIQNFMNYMVTDVMREYRPETEKMLFSLPLAGSAFKKVYWDPNKGRPCSMFIPSEDMVVSYGAPSLETAERVTQVMKMSSNDLRKMQVSGFYRDVEIPDPSPDPDDIQKKYDELTGEEPSYEFDNRYTLLEVHVNLDLEGFEDEIDGEETGIALPYVVTLELGSSEVLSVRRNWFEDDEKRLPRQHFVHYEYIPGLGFYGFGLIHMVGGIAKSATSILRQLVDAGTLSNLPGGLKSRGLRIRGDDSPISPGEFRDVDVPGGAIRDNITFLPYKEPSPVLFQLLGNIVEEGRRFASLTDLNVNDMNQEAPVGTTLALMERSMKVMSAIQARVHASMRREFEILEGIVKDHAPHEYPYDLEGEEGMKSDDFDDRIDVLPVSDPNSATMAQRIMQYQSALQLAGSAPELYNLPQLHRQMLEVLGINDPENIIPLEDDMTVKDPILENMNLIVGEPVKAFLWQDHEAHIQAHMAASQDPKMQEMLAQSPNAGSVSASFSAHVTEHLAFAYRKQIEEQLGAALPPENSQLSDDSEVQLSKLVSEAAQKLLQKHQSEQQQAENQEQAEDPIIQMRQKELEIREQEVRAKVENAQQKIALDQQKAQQNIELEQQKAMVKAIYDQQRNEMDRERAASSERMAGAKIMADVASSTMKIEADAESEQVRAEADERIAGAKVGADIMSTIMDAQFREQQLSAEDLRTSARIADDISRRIIEAEKVTSSEKVEGGKIGSKIIEKIIDMYKEHHESNEKEGDD